MITRMLFSTSWNLRWWIKTNLVWRWQIQWLQEYYFLYVGTLSDASKPIFLEVMYAVIARVLFSSCWDILWCIKTNLVWRCQMQWLQEYSFSSCLDILWCIKTNFLLKYCMQILGVIARVLFPACWNIVGWIKTHFVFKWWIQKYFKITVFYLMKHCLMHQNEFSFEVLYAVIAWVLFSACWDILWYIKMTFLFKYCIKWLQE